jgi:hypothetical protein
MKGVNMTKYAASYWVVVVLAGAVAGCGGQSLQSSGVEQPVAPMAAHPLGSLPSTADFMPLGVYWPGEWMFRSANRQIDWARNEPILESLAKHHCNAIWSTHLSAAEGAELARRAARRGIFIVASISEIAGDVSRVRNGDAKRLVDDTLTKWGDAPSPIAWGLGDEPRTHYMQEMGRYSAVWAKTGRPLTAVVMAVDIPAAASLMKLNFLCSDIYPFFSPGNPNGPSTMAESAAYVAQAGHRAQYWSRKAGIEWWFMGAIFQEPWGNRELDEHGNIVYAAGAAPGFRMPSPAEVQWETWAALAAGARGVFHFSLFFNVGAAKDPNAKRLAWGFAEKTNSGAPGGMLYPDGRPTPQYEAMGESFAAIGKLAPVFKQIAPVTTADEELLAWHASGWVPPGDIVQVFRSTANHAVPAYYAVVVNGEVAGKQAREIPVNLRDDVARVIDLRSEHPVSLIDRAISPWEPIFPSRQARIRLAPGDGTLLKLILK